MGWKGNGEWEWGQPESVSERKCCERRISRLRAIWESEMHRNCLILRSKKSISDKLSGCPPFLENPSQSRSAPVAQSYMKAPNSAGSAEQRLRRVCDGGTNHEMARGA